MKRSSSPTFAHGGDIAPKRPRASSHGSIQNGSFYEVEEVKETRGIDEVVEQKKATVISAEANKPDEQSAVRSIIWQDYDDFKAKDDIVDKVGEAFGYEARNTCRSQRAKLAKLREKLLSVGRAFCRRSF